MKRRLFTVLAPVSLVLLLLLVTVTIRSFRVADGWTWSDGVRVDTAGYHLAWRQVLVVQWGRIFYIKDRAMGAVSPFSARLDPELADFGVQMFWSGPADFRVAGFERHIQRGYPFIANTRIGPPVELTRVWVVPLWPLIVLTAIPPTLWLWKWTRTRHRAEANVCAICGYDLRASPDYCPECGATVSHRAAQ